MHDGDVCIVTGIWVGWKSMLEWGPCLCLEAMAEWAQYTDLAFICLRSTYLLTCATSERHCIDSKSSTVLVGWSKKLAFRVDFFPLLLAHLLPSFTFTALPHTRSLALHWALC